MAPPTGAPSLGRSLKLDQGDLVFDAANGDLTMVEQQDALEQALVLAIQTQVGSDRINVGFGFDRLSVGAYAYGIDTRKAYVKMQLVKTVSAEPRVRDVREVFFQDDPRFFELQPALAAAQDQIAAAARASREYTVYVTVETIAEDPLTVSAADVLPT
jgi:hypothetical protein